MPLQKIVLVYPPFASPTAPPLGVCSLKSFTEKMVPECSVKVLDLNVACFDAIFSAVEQGGGLERQRFPEGNLAEIALLKTRDVFRGLNPNQFYLRPDLYTVYADFFNRLVEQQISGIAFLENVFASQAESALPKIFSQQAAQILSENPGLVGISVCFNQQFWWGACLAKALRRESRVPIAFGGTFFGADTERFLREFGRVADYAVSEEGEYALAQLARDPGQPDKAPGLAWIDQSGTFHCNTPAFVAPLDDLPLPDYSDLNLRSYLSPEPVLPVLSSRGCYWRRCAFCVHYKSAGLTYRTYSIPKVVSWLRRQVEAGVSNFSFIDEMISPAQFRKLAEGILESGLKINYYALAKPVKQFDAPLLAQIEQSGCRFLLWGVESGCQRIVDLMDKGTRVAEISEVLKNAHAAGIRNHVYIIVGFPTESLSDVQETIDFLDLHKDVISQVHRGTFTLEAGSIVSDNPARFSILRTWKQTDSIVPRPLGYECASGLSREQSRDVFASVLPFLRPFNPYAQNLGNFRDHALLVYSKVGQLLQMGSRPLPPKPQLVPPAARN